MDKEKINEVLSQYATEGFTDDGSMTDNLVPEATGGSEMCCSVDNAKPSDKKIIKIEATNEDAKKVYEEAYADRYDYLIGKHKLVPREVAEKAKLRARAIAAHSVIMSSLEERRDYLMCADRLNLEDAKNYDVFVPQTIVGCLRHPILLKQIYKTETSYGDEYTVDVEWYDEETDSLKTDTWTPEIKSPEYGTQWSGDVIVPFDIALAVSDCYDHHFGNKNIDKTYSRAEHYYINADPEMNINHSTFPYTTYDGKTYNHKDLVTGEVLKSEHNSVLEWHSIYAHTYLDLHLWMLKCNKCKLRFIVDSDGKHYWTKWLDDCDYKVKTCETYEECIIWSINFIHSLGYFHPYYTWYDEKYTEQAAQKIVSDGLWTPEECEVNTGYSGYGKNWKIIRDGINDGKES